MSPVIVDSREPEKIKKILKLSGIDFTIKQLESADVVCKHPDNNDIWIAIERKRIDDLVSSYIDKRMDSQFERLSHHKFAMLVITGDLKKVKHNFPFPIMPNFIAEVISKAVIGYNFRSVVWLLEGIDDPDYEAFSLVVKAVNMVVNGKLDNIPERHVKTAKDIRVDSLKKTLGLNSKICIKLLKKHGTVMKVLQLKDNQFLQIEGIGPAHVKRIRNILSANYNERKGGSFTKTVVERGNISGEKCKKCGESYRIVKTSLGNFKLCKCIRKK